MHDHEDNQNEEDKAAKAYAEAERRIANWRKGTKLDLSIQGLAQIPPEIGNLTRLTLLTFYDLTGPTRLPLSDLAPLKQLTQLQALDCSDTQVSDLAPLKQLTQLQVLDCLDTQVSDLAPLKQLKNLQYLDCSGTQVSDLTPLKQLTQLRTLNCSYTKVSLAPPEIWFLPKLEEVYLAGASLPAVPPEIFGHFRHNCLEDLRAHYRDLGEALLDANDPPSTPDFTEIASLSTKSENNPFEDLPDQDPDIRFEVVGADQLQLVSAHDEEESRDNFDDFKQELIDDDGPIASLLSIFESERKSNQPHVRILMPLVRKYQQEVQKTDPRIALIFARGQRLENAFDAVKVEITSGEFTLDAEEIECLESLMDIHSILMMQTKAGRRFIEDAVVTSHTQEDYEQFKRLISQLVKSLTSETTILEPQTRSTLNEFVEDESDSKHKMRMHRLRIALTHSTLATIVGGVTWLSSIGSATIAIPLAAGGLILWEVVKKLESFKSGTDNLAKRIDQLTDQESIDNQEGQLNLFRRLKSWSKDNLPLLEEITNFSKEFSIFRRGLKKVNEPVPSSDESNGFIVSESKREPDTSNWFVSYAQSDNAEEKGAPVEQLVAAAKDRGVVLRRDIDGLKKGQSISAFMDELAEGDRVFVYLTDAYLKSPFCMYELHKLWLIAQHKPEKFIGKIRVLLGKGIRLRMPTDKLTYSSFWLDEKKRLDAYVQEHTVAPLGERGSQDYVKIDTFAPHTMDILTIVADHIQCTKVEEWLDI